MQYSTPLQRILIGIKADPAEGHHDADVLQTFHLTIEEGRAVGKLGGSGFVIGRGAAGRSRDIGILEFEPIATMGAIGLVRESGTVKNGIHKITRSVAGKRASSAIGSVGSRCEAEDQDAG